MSRFAAALVGVVIALAGSASAAHAAVSIAAPSPASVTEGDSGTKTVSFTLTRTAAGLGGAAATATVKLSATGTASCPADVSPCQVSVPLSAGLVSSTTGTASFQVVGDTLNEPDETIVAQVTDAAPDTVDATKGSATVTILNDDPIPSVGVGAASVPEGTGATPTTLNIPLTLSAASGQDVQVGYTLAAGSADASDVALGTGTVTIPAGQTTAAIPAQVVADSVDEDDETFTATIATPVNATLGTATSATATILDDDTAALSLGDATGKEAAGPLAFTVSLSVPSSKPITVDYATHDGTATAPGDYTPTSGTLTFAPGETSKGLAVPIVNDSIAEPNEYFLVSLTGASNAAVARGDAVGGIFDDDGPGGGAVGVGGGSGSGAGGSGAGGGSGGGGTDSSPPAVKLSAFRLRRPATLTVSLSCPASEQSCKTMVSVFSSPTPKSRVSYFRKERRLGGTTVMLAGGKQTVVTLKVGKAIAADLHKAKTQKATVFAVARDAAGNIGTAQLRGTLKG